MSDGLPSLYHFADPLPTEVEDGAALLGGKGASLRRILARGLEVPPGFTITTAICRAYFNAGNKLTNDAWREIHSAVERLATDAGRTFGDRAHPMLLAVRSGAASSMPGAMTTLLNCGAADDPWAELRDAVTAVFDSWRSHAAREYRRINQLDDDAGTAVTVQMMVAVRRRACCSRAIRVARTQTRCLLKRLEDREPRSLRARLSLRAGRCRALRCLGRRLNAPGTVTWC